MSNKTVTTLSGLFEWIGVPSHVQKRFFMHLVLFLVALTVVISVDPTGFTPKETEGMPAVKTIHSPRLISFIDDVRTSELRAIERNRVQPVYTMIDGAEENMFEGFDSYISNLKLFFTELKGLPSFESPKNLIASHFPNESLLEPEQLAQLRILRPIQFESIIDSSRKILLNLSQRVIFAKNLESVRADELRTYINSYPESLSYKAIMTSLVRSSLMVNAIEDEKLTHKKRESAMRAIQPVVRTFQKGQRIIDEGAIITADDYFVLKEIAKQMHKNRLLSTVGSFLLVLLFIYASIVFLKIEGKSVITDIEQYKLLCILCFTAVLLAKIVYTLGVIFDLPDLLILFTPLPTVALLMAILLDSRVAFFHVFLLGLLMFVVAESDTRFVMISMFSSVVGIIEWRSLSRASDARILISSVGVKIGIVNSISIFIFILLDSEGIATMNLTKIATLVTMGMFNGIFSGILANGVLPYMESVFSLATNSRLLELADLSQPLLKKLAQEAPGTYQHSIAVATLAEAAANGIDADSLLIKIAAYFHDIGKIKRPLYFAENQIDENRHDQVTPFMSSLILTGHVRESLDLGREYRLPERVLSIMSQHHGTTLISYFYEEAKKLKDGEDVNQERFRYPGPKPRTKEAAILMLADSVEAAARTLPQHTHSKIEGLVQRIIEHKLKDENQLDESDLTLKDIERIEHIFVRTLSSMYHGRIDYPGKLSNLSISATMKGVPNGSSDQQ